MSLQKLDAKLFACGNQFLGDLIDQAIDRSEAPFPFDKTYILRFNYLVGKDNKVNAIKKMNAVYYPPLAGLPEPDGRAVHLAAGGEAPSQPSS